MHLFLVVLPPPQRYVNLWQKRELANQTHPSGFASPPLPMRAMFFHETFRKGLFMYEMSLHAAGGPHPPPSQSASDSLQTPPQPCRHSFGASSGGNRNHLVRVCVSGVSLWGHFGCLASVSPAGASIWSVLLAIALISSLCDWRLLCRLWERTFLIFFFFLENDNQRLTFARINVFFLFVCLFLNLPHFLILVSFDLKITFSQFLVVSFDFFFFSEKTREKKVNFWTMACCGTRVVIIWLQRLSHSERLLGKKKKNVSSELQIFAFVNVISPAERRCSFPECRLGIKWNNVITIRHQTAAGQASATRWNLTWLFNGGSSVFKCKRAVA